MFLSYLGCTVVLYSLERGIFIDTLITPEIFCPGPWLFKRWIYPVDNAIGFVHVYLAPVVQKEDSSIHRINHYPVDSTIGFALMLFRWIVIYPVNSAIHLLNNRALLNSAIHLYNNLGLMVLLQYATVLIIHLT